MGLFGTPDRITLNNHASLLLFKKFRLFKAAPTPPSPLAPWHVTQCAANNGAPRSMRPAAICCWAVLKRSGSRAA
jgi:hypothetical protein